MSESKTLFKGSESVRRVNRKGVAAYRQRNLEEVRRRNREYLKRNHDRLQERRRMRQLALRGYVGVQGCIVCGATERLHLDHRDDEIKRFDPSATAMRAWSSLWAEWAKCDVRCATCHHKRHAVTRSRDERGRFRG